MRPAQPRAAAELAQEAGLHRVAAQCLLNRGVGEPEAVRQFLRGGLGTLLRPDALPDIEPAVARIRRALRERETICVWGDYDVDGVAGAALFVRFLRLLGAARVVPFLPQRTGSGYGFHWPTMERLAREEGVTLFVSVDHGSTAFDAVRRARDAGLDVVVADHHEMSDPLPPAVAIVNPKRADSAYGFASLCGTGVAMKLAWAVASELSPDARVSDEVRAFLIDALAFAVLGTVADVVPLVGENRVIVRHGLSVLAARSHAGVAALLDVAGVRGPLRASDVAFKLAPRLNAAGRMGSADAALELLLTDDPVRAGDLARRLEAANERRRAIERSVADEARACVTREFGGRPSDAIALHGDAWHHGVIGIVAARLVDEFHVPVVIVSSEGGVGRGSARSVPGFALHEALAACGEHLVAHGGHAAAAGLTIEPARFPAFRDAFRRYAAEHVPDASRTPTLELDAEVEPGDVDPSLAACLERLEPFGAGNPEPLLLLRRVTVAGRPRRMGAESEHVAFHAGRDGRALRCVAFRRAAELAPLLESGAPLDIAFAPQQNAFRGAHEVEGLVRDVRASSDD